VNLSFSWRSPPAGQEQIKENTANIRMNSDEFPEIRDTCRWRGYQVVAAFPDILSETIPENRWIFTFPGNISPIP
jgi:hypothetical protein